MAAPKIGYRQTSSKYPQLREVREERKGKERHPAIPWLPTPPVLQAGRIQGKAATSWEMAVAKELDRRRLRYQFQVTIRGAKGSPGSKTLDFYVYSYPNAILRIQGTYWHSGALNENKDRVEAMLLRIQFPGVRIIDILQVDIENPALLRSKLDVLGQR